MPRKKRCAEFKAKVALESLKSDKAINEIAGAHQVHPNQVSSWNNEAQAGLAEYFQFYNETRPHQSLNYATPHEVHGG